MPRKKSRIYTCPIPKDEFPYHEHYRGESPVCPVCGLDLTNLEKVAEKVFNTWIEKLKSKGIDSKIVHTEKTTAVDYRGKEWPCIVAFFEFDGKMGVLSISEMKFDRYVEYRMDGGVEKEDNPNVIEFTPFSTSCLGLLYQLVLPRITKRHPLLHGD